MSQIGDIAHVKNAAERAYYLGEYEKTLSILENVNKCDKVRKTDEKDINYIRGKSLFMIAKRSFSRGDYNEVLRLLSQINSDNAKLVVDIDTLRGACENKRHL